MEGVDPGVTTELLRGSPWAIVLLLVAAIVYLFKALITAYLARIEDANKRANDAELRTTTVIKALHDNEKVMLELKHSLDVPKRGGK